MFENDLLNCHTCATHKMPNPHFFNKKNVSFVLAFHHQPKSNVFGDTFLVMGEENFEGRFSKASYALLVHRW